QPLPLLLLLLSLPLLLPLSCFVVGFGLSAKPTAQRPATLPKTVSPTRVFARRVVTLERSPRGKTTDFIIFVGAVIFYLPFSAQKSHVKPPNHLTSYSTTTSAWHVS